jgi:LmbE family N-acetylglucosaminyl deacetylase
MQLSLPNRFAERRPELFVTTVGPYATRAGGGSGRGYEGMATILGLWAHPDDEVFVSGGLMARAVQRGDRVVCIHMTRGEAGLCFRQRSAPGVLALIRQRELEASLARLGVEEQRFFDYPDGGLHEVPPDEAIARIGDAIADVQPDVMVTFGPDGFTGHPDHVALSEWVTEALTSWDNRTSLYHAAVSHGWSDSITARLGEVDFFWPGNPMPGPVSDVSLQLDDDVLSLKMEALRAHASQMKPLFDAYGDEFMREIARTEHFRLAPARAPSTHRRQAFPASA